MDHFDEVDAEECLDVKEVPLDALAGAEVRIAYRDVQVAGDDPASVRAADDPYDPDVEADLLNDLAGVPCLAPLDPVACPGEAAAAFDDRLVGCHGVTPNGDLAVIQVVAACVACLDGLEVGRLACCEVEAHLSGPV